MKRIHSTTRPRRADSYATTLEKINQMVRSGGVYVPSQDYVRFAEGYYSETFTKSSEQRFLPDYINAITAPSNSAQLTVGQQIRVTNTNDGTQANGVVVSVAGGPAPAPYAVTWKVIDTTASNTGQVDATFRFEGYNVTSPAIPRRADSKLIIAQRLLSTQVGKDTAPSNGGDDVPMPDPITEGLMAWWSMGQAGSSNRLDAKGGSPFVVLTPSLVGSVTGRVGNATSVALGDTTYPSLAASSCAAAVLGNYDFTMSYWAAPTVVTVDGDDGPVNQFLGTAHPTFSKFGPVSGPIDPTSCGGTNGQEWAIYGGGTGYSFWFDDGVQEADGFNWSIPVDPGDPGDPAKYYHFVLQLNVTGHPSPDVPKAKLYANGVLLGGGEIDGGFAGPPLGYSTYDDGDGNLIPAQPGLPLFMCNRCDGWPGAFGFQGGIDEVAMWHRLLTESEINRLYNNGNGMGYPG